MQLPVYLAVYICRRDWVAVSGCAVRWRTALIHVSASVDRDCAWCIVKLKVQADANARRDTHADALSCPCMTFLLLLSSCWLLQDDIELINRAGQGRVDVTIGSALDLFGGPVSYAEVVFWHLQQRSSS